ncbi:hypothetical protein DMA15_09660 [Streptomyces sp. WAC 01529]|uniref:hypothetical protein n=1 Tax=Streptomyces sp. WAC 01529 TaxID=2203205 RepID=UPI000F6E289E|nr:hypothetical protein [Streptomyces sp. WAC 01529]AZM52833.1 hypothetical protein DMA15_09660 [Streptomyces sp. WAC 01529]
MSTERSDHEVAERQRRRARLAVASVAATVLLVGGGGAYFAATASGGGGQGGDGAPAGDGGDPPPLALDGYTGADRQGEGAHKGTDGTGGTAGIAPGEPDPSGARYKATGKLPKGPESASVHHARGEVTRAEVTALAKALGLSGTPTSRDGAWRVEQDKDGSGPSLQVTKQAPGTWTYSGHGTGGTDNCPKAKPCSATSPLPNGDADDAVGEKAAKKAAAPLLKALGQDDAKLDARQLMGAVRVVNADPKVDGLPTYGWSTGVQVGPDGQVVGGSGQLKAPVKGAEYPVIGAREALDQLNSTRGDGRVGIGGCATPVPHADDSTKTEGGSTKAEGGAEQAPCEPSSTPPKPRSIAVSGATFGLATHFVGGKQTLVPSWLFEVKPQGATDTFTVTHPAVAPKYLTSPSTPGTPTPPGEPEKPRAKGSVPIESYSADGKKLTVHFWGGVCSEYSASAREDGDRVRVTVKETKQEDKVCVMVAKRLSETVTLGKPLGEREVVDASGETVKRK